MNNPLFVQIASLAARLAGSAEDAAAAPHQQASTSNDISLLSHTSGHAATHRDTTTLPLASNTDAEELVDRADTVSLRSTIHSIVPHDFYTQDGDAFLPVVVSPSHQGSDTDEDDEKTSDDDFSDDDEDEDEDFLASPDTAASSSSEEIVFQRRAPASGPPGRSPLLQTIEEQGGHSIDVTVSPGNSVQPQRRQTAQQLDKLHLELKASRPRSASFAVHHHRSSIRVPLVQVKPAALSVAEKIRLAFDLPTVEAYEGEFQCWLVKSVLLKGCLFLTDKSLCFYAKLPKQAGEIQLSGFLAKKSSKRSNITYWFVLKDGILSYYDNPKELYFPRGSIDMKTVTDLALSKTKECGFKVVTASGKTYRLLADTKQSQIEWKKAIEAAHFRARNEGDNVRIVLPYANIAEINWVSSSLMTDSIMLKVMDTNDAGETLMDEYYFSYFPSTERAFRKIEQLMMQFEQRQQPSHRLGLVAERRPSGVRDSTLLSGCSETDLFPEEPRPAMTVPLEATEHPDDESGQWRVVKWWRSGAVGSVGSQLLRRPWARHRKTGSDASRSSQSREASASPPRPTSSLSPLPQTTVISIEELRRYFPLPEKDQSVLGVYGGYLVSGYLPKYGKIYLTDRHMCFHSRLVGVRTKMMVPFVDMETAVTVSGMFYHGLYILTRDQTEMWFEFYSSELRDRCLSQLHQLMGPLNSTSPSTSEASVSPPFGENSLRNGKHYRRSSFILDEIHRMDKQFAPMSFNERELNALPPLAAPSSVLVKPTRPMRISCLAIGTRGDIQPFIALCKGLKKHGHYCKIATHVEYKEWIESHGIEFGYVGGNPADLMKLCVDNSMLSIGFIREASSKFRDWIDDLLVTAWEACRDSEVLIASPVAMAGYHIADKLRIPLFTAFPMPWTRTREFPHPFATPETNLGASYNVMTWSLMEQFLWRFLSGQINRWRKRTLGLPAISGAFLDEDKVPVLYPFSPAVVRPPVDWHGWVHLCGYWFLDNPNLEWQPSEELKAFLQCKDGEKIVYIGFGSIIVPDPDKLTRTIVEAVRRAGIKAILSKGWSARGQESGNRESTTEAYPPFIFPLEHVPHDWLFPQLHGVVHHGGAGTTAAALRAGIPAVIKPFFGDQYFWANCVQDLGAGVAVKKLEVDALTNALIRITSDGRIANRAKMVGQRIQSEDGVANAIAIIHRNVAFREEQLQRQNEPAAAQTQHTSLSPELTSRLEADGASPATTATKRFSYLRKAFSRRNSAKPLKETDEDHGYASDSSISYASPALGRKVAPVAKPNKLRRRFLPTASATSKPGSLSDGEAEDDRRMRRSASASPAKMNETTLASYVAKHLQMDVPAPAGSSLLLGGRPAHMRHRQHRSDTSAIHRFRMRSSSRDKSSGEERRPASRGVLSRVSGFFKDY